MNKPWDYKKIISDRAIFYITVYTPLSEAIKLLNERQKNPELCKKIEALLNGDIPEALKKMDRFGISGKQVATPNADTRWFLGISKEFGLKPVFFEYLEDKFTSNNSFKHSLGQLIIRGKTNKKGEEKIEKVTIVDFNKYNGKKLKDVKTLWGEPLADFHKSLFSAYKFDKDNIIFYDESSWLKRNGGKAKEYYEKDLLLYVCHGILFENFLTEGEEGRFSKEILLPALEKVIALTGVKPLIVPIPPMDIEDDPFWVSHDPIIKPFIKD